MIRIWAPKLHCLIKWASDIENDAKTDRTVDHLHHLLAACRTVVANHREDLFSIQLRIYRHGDRCGHKPVRDPPQEAQTVSKKAIRDLPYATLLTSTLLSIGQNHCRTGLSPPGPCPGQSRHGCFYLQFSNSLESSPQSPCLQVLIQFITVTDYRQLGLLPADPIALEVNGTFVALISGSFFQIMREVRI